MICLLNRKGHGILLELNPLMLLLCYLYIECTVYPLNEGKEDSFAKNIQGFLIRSLSRWQHTVNHVWAHRKQRRGWFIQDGVDQFIDWPHKLEGFSKEGNDKTSSSCCQVNCMNLHVTLPFNKRDTESTEEEDEKRGGKVEHTYIQSYVLQTYMHVC